MSMQSQRGGWDGMPAIPHESDHGTRSGAPGLAPNVVAGLAGGLRAVYEVRPDADMPDAFADLLIRIEAAERARA